MPTEEKILTLHPEGKNGVNISRKKYDQIHSYIMKVLNANDRITYQELNEMAIEQLKDSFDGKVPWYVVTVKLDMEARGEIERIPNTSPHEIRIKSS